MIITIVIIITSIANQNIIQFYLHKFIFNKWNRVTDPSEEFLGIELNVTLNSAPDLYRF